MLIPDGDDIGLPPALAGEGGIGEYLAGVPVDDVESLDLARVPEIVGHRLVHAQVRVLGRHLRYERKKLARKYKIGDSVGLLAMILLSWVRSFSRKKAWQFLGKSGILEKKPNFFSWLSFNRLKKKPSIFRKCAEPDRH